uniref:Ubiquitin-like protease family profile domain-containing protein n=1 Tax=Ditylenchus dipsaci TaxID=166011 RepID=A0A915DCA9_9BILA
MKLLLFQVYAFDTLLYSQLKQKGPNKALNWTNNVDLFNFDLLLLLIHSPGHWSLVVINVEKVIINYYDSLHGDGNPHSNLTREFCKICNRKRLH